MYTGVGAAVDDTKILLALARDSCPTIMATIGALTDLHTPFQYSLSPSDSSQRSISIFETFIMIKYHRNMSLFF